jgi:hypothetical protein
MRVAVIDIGKPGRNLGWAIGPAAVLVLFGYTSFSLNPQK